MYIESVHIVCIRKRVKSSRYAHRKGWLQWLESPPSTWIVFLHSVPGVLVHPPPLEPPIYANSWF